LQARDERPFGARAAGGAAAVVALLAIVAVGAAGSLHTDPTADRTAARIATFPLLALLGAAAAAAVITTVISRRRLAAEAEDDDEEPDAGEPGSRLLRIALLLTPLAVLGALIFAIAIRPPPEPQPQEQVAPPPAGAPADRAGDGNDWGIVAFAGGALVATALFGSALWGARAHRTRGIEPLRGPAADPAAAVDDALAALDAETDPRRSIVAAYVRMERALDAAGLGRREPEAPREYLARVAGALRGDARAARRLTALYEEARFSTHPLDEGMRAEAVAALHALRAEAAP
jgi:Domain of unknown function (DUF4129)